MTTTGRKAVDARPNESVLTFLGEARVRKCSIQIHAIAPLRDASALTEDITMPRIRADYDPSE